MTPDMLIRRRLAGARSGGRYAVLGLTSDIIAFTNTTNIEWDEVRKGNSDLWNVANPTRLIAPTNASYVILRGVIRFANSTAQSSVNVDIRKNGSYIMRCAERRAFGGSSSNILPFSTPPIPVSNGDYFEIHRWTSDVGLRDNLASNSWFEIEGIS